MAAKLEVRKARDVGLTFLSARDRSVQEMREKLLQNKFAPEVIDEAIADLQRLNLLDDRTFAHRWVESRLQGKAASRRKFAQDLQRKGIHRDIIDAVLEEFKDRLESEAAAVNLLRRVAWRYRGVDRVKAKRRMFGLLGRRGYEHETAIKAIEQIWEEIERDDLEGD